MLCNRTKHIPLHVVQHIMKIYLGELGFSKYESYSMNDFLPVIVFTITNIIIINIILYSWN